MPVQCGPKRIQRNIPPAQDHGNVFVLIVACSLKGSSDGDAGRSFNNEPFIGRYIVHGFRDLCFAD